MKCAKMQKSAHYVVCFDHFECLHALLALGSPMVVDCLDFGGETPL